MNLRRPHNRDKWRVMVRLLLKLRSCFAGRRQKFRCFCSFRLLLDVYSALPQDYSAFQFSFSNRDHITQWFGHWNYARDKMFWGPAKDENISDALAGCWCYTENSLEPAILLTFTTNKLRIVHYDLFGFGNDFEITFLLRVGKIPLMVNCSIARLDFNEEHKV
jgi:hypothetical protein